MDAIWYAVVSEQGFFRPEYQNWSQTFHPCCLIPKGYAEELAQQVGGEVIAYSIRRV